MTPRSAVSTQGAQLPFTIGELKTAEDIRLVESLQRDVWAMHDDTEVVPLHVLLTAQKNGGLVLGAFDEAGGIIGFVFGFLGRTANGRWKHCSHMLGVLPDYRHSGIGAALKRRQRECVLRQGLNLITWTFDPLEGVNASLNFGKLGVVCRTYYRNLYGEMPDDLNQGLPTDRFEVEWWITSQRVEDRLRPGEMKRTLAAIERVGLRPVIPTDRQGEQRQPLEPALTLEAPQLLVETPADFQAVKAVSMELAMLWRRHTRAAFETYFKAGYLAGEFFSEQTENGRRNFYLLERSVPGLSAVRQQRAPAHDRGTDARRAHE